MSNFFQDLKYGFRMLGKSPGVTAVAVISLALGIGANATIFSWMNSVLLNPIPGVADVSPIVEVYPISRNIGFESLSYPNYRDYRDRNTVLAGLTVYDMIGLSLGGDQSPERVWGQLVSGNFFDVLGVRAQLGRTFLPDEDKVPGAKPVVVISHGLWQRRFSGDAGVVGKTVLLNNQNFTIIGVAPREFQGSFTGLTFDTWVPMMMLAQVQPGQSRLEQRGNSWLAALGRLKPGVTSAQAEAQLSSIAVDLVKEFPQTNSSKSVRVFPLSKSPRGAVQVLGPVLMILMGVTGLVLLIACANVANLMLARATARKREIAIRISLGAGRARLIRQLLIESVMLASLGGVLGILVSFWSSNLLTLLIPPADFPIGLQLGVDGRVLAFSFTLMVLSGIVFGLVPALQATRSDVVSSLKDEAGAVAGGRGKARLRNSLVVAQVSLSLVLLVAAGLFIRSIDRARSFSPGFNPQNVLLMNYDLFSNGYDAPRGTAFHKQLLERMQALPGVKSVTLCRRIPLGFGGRSSTSFQVEGYTPGKDESVWAYYNKGGPNFLTTMEIPLVSGRDFSFQDTLETQRVAIINQTLAQRYWKDRDPIGQRINFGGEWTTIVGVARDFKLDQLNEPPAPFVLLPLLQSYSSGVTLELRTASNPTAIAGAARQVFQELDSQLPVYSVRTLEGHISAASFQQRMAGSLLGVFGALALVLAAVGLYGVMAYTVAQRTHEIGVRMALGARRADILQMILRTGMSVTGIGVALGLAAAFGASRLLAKLLFGVSPNDAVTYSGVAVLLLAVALLACWIPARRATRVNPIIALRYE